MTTNPTMAESFELTQTELKIDGQQFPYFIHEDGPRIEPAFDGEYTTLWVPVLVAQPCPQLGPPESATATCLAHKPVQHRDGKPPWCKACGNS